MPVLEMPRLAEIQSAQIVALLERILSQAQDGLEYFVGRYRVFLIGTKKTCSKKTNREDRIERSWVKNDFLTLTQATLLIFTIYVHST